MKRHVTEIEEQAVQLQATQEQARATNAQNVELRAQLKAQVNFQTMQQQIDRMQAQLISPSRDPEVGLAEQHDSQPFQEAALTSHGAQDMVEAHVAGSISASVMQSRLTVTQVSITQVQDVEVDALAAIARARSLTPGRRHGDNRRGSPRSRPLPQGSCTVISRSPCRSQAGMVARRTGHSGQVRKV